MSSPYWTRTSNPAVNSSSSSPIWTRTRNPSVTGLVKTLHCRESANVKSFPLGASRRVATGREMGVEDRWAEYLTSEGLRRETIRLKITYIGTLSRALEKVGASLLEAEESDLVRWIANPRWGPEAKKSARSVARGFFEWAEGVGLIERSPAARLKTIRVPAGKPKPAPEAALEQALEGADELDRAILLLAAFAGLRRAEIAELRVEDVTAYGLRVTGKGGRTRMVPVHPKLEEALRVRAAAVEGPWLFPSPVKKGVPVTPDFIYRHVKRLTGSYPPHTFRHRFATRAYAGTNDLRAVQELLGHSSPVTTMRYTLIGADALTAAVLSVA